MPVIDGAAALTYDAELERKVESEMVMLSPEYARIAPPQVLREIPDISLQLAPFRATRLRVLRLHCAAHAPGAQVPR